MKVCSGLNERLVMSLYADATVSFWKDGKDLYAAGKIDALAAVLESVYSWCPDDFCQFRKEIYERRCLKND